MTINSLVRHIRSFLSLVAGSYTSGVYFIFEGRKIYPSHYKVFSNVMKVYFRREDS